MGAVGITSSQYRGQLGASNVKNANIRDNGGVPNYLRFANERRVGSNSVVFGINWKSFDKANGYDGSRNRQAIEERNEKRREAYGKFQKAISASKSRLEKNGTAQYNKSYQTAINSGKTPAQARKIATQAVNKAQTVEYRKAIQKAGLTRYTKVKKTVKEALGNKR